MCVYIFFRRLLNSTISNMYEYTLTLKALGYSVSLLFVDVFEVFLLYFCGCYLCNVNTCHRTAAYTIYTRTHISMQSFKLDTIRHWYRNFKLCSLRFALLWYNIERFKNRFQFQSIGLVVWHLCASIAVFFPTIVLEEEIHHIIQP